MKKSLLSLLAFCLIQTITIAQNEIDRAYIIEQTNVEALKEIAERSNEFYISCLTKPENKDVKKTIFDDNNNIGYLSGFDEQGMPVYDFEDNVNLAKTSRIDRIWQGGTSGLDLDGSGIEIGQWEAGGVPRTTHQEFNGKVTHGEVAIVSSHSTHTSCTMVGTGVNQFARGVASNATVVSRRSNNDEFEVASFAAAGGILSNHSYSTGNPNGSITLYGRYTANSKEWDEILYNAPYLTICKSASNDRDDGVNPGDLGYDLVYSLATSKNLITVGAVDDAINYFGPAAVLQSWFGSWGPTDDWRIKPDLVANGVSVTSADDDGDTQYSSRNGTSMSTPAVTGTVALLQQHFHNMNGVYMKAATVKTLLLGTTLEAGANDGPDFQSGWGLLNALEAANVITNNGSTTQIDELTLENGDTYTTEIEIDGNSPLMISIAWTDPSGSVSIGTDNKTPILVNDLDVRVSNGDVTFEPWVLTPNGTSNNFQDAATKGDNFRDNIERIDIKSLEPGNYTVTVMHKEDLVNNSQDFSMVINGIAEGSLSTEYSKDLNNSILIYPNPSNDGYFSLTMPKNEVSESYSIGIYDTLGRILQNNTYNNSNVNLDLSSFNTGLYIVKIQIGNTEYVKHIAIR